MAGSDGCSWLRFGGVSKFNRLTINGIMLLLIGLADFLVWLGKHPFSRFQFAASAVFDCGRSDDTPRAGDSSG